MTEAQMQEFRERLQKAIQDWPDAESVEIVDGDVLASFPDFDIAVMIEPV